MTVGVSKPRWWPVSLPSLVFALAFIVLGWIASHYIAYAFLALMEASPHGHHHHHDGSYVHGYMGTRKIAAGGGAALAFVLVLRALFRHGSFGEWMHEGGLSGTRKQILLATILPASVFVVVEYLERLAAGTGTTPPVQLLVVGVLVQLVVGLLCLGLVRLALRVTERVVRHARGRRFVRPVGRADRAALVDIVLVRSLCPMAGAKAGRAPPHLKAVLT